MSSRESDWPWPDLYDGWRRWLQALAPAYMTPDRKPAFNDFREVMGKIRSAKAGAAARRLSETGITRLAEALKDLRDTDRDRYKRLAAILRSALDGGQARAGGRLPACVRNNGFPSVPSGGYGPRVGRPAAG